MNFANVLRHPFFLFWHPETHPDEIGARRIDGLYVGGVFLLVKRAEWRRPVSCDHQPRKAMCEALDELLDDARAPTIEKMAVGAVRRDLAHRHKQIRPGDAARIREARV